MSRPLLLLELQRQRRVVGRMALMAIVVGVVFFVAGKRTTADFLAVLIGSSLGTVLIVPMGVARDKMEGTLDFVCGLPVSPGDIAASRFVAVGLLAAPWAVSIGALAAVARAPLQLNPASVTVFAWLVLSALGAFGTALLARYEFEDMLGAPIVALVILVVLIPRLVHALLPNVTPDMVRRWVVQPERGAVIVAVMFVTILLTGIFSYRLAERGFASYRPGSPQR